MKKVTRYAGCDSPSNFCEVPLFCHYRIVCDYESSSRKYGIIDCDRFVFIVPYVFDKIRWIEKDHLVEVVYQGKCALCSIGNIRKLVPVSGIYPELENNAIPYYASFQREYDDITRVAGITKIESSIENGSYFEDKTSVSNRFNSYSEVMMNPNGYFGPLEVWDPNKVGKLSSRMFLDFPDELELYKQYMYDNERVGIVFRYFTIVLVNGHPYRFYSWLLEYGEFEENMFRRLSQWPKDEEDARRSISVFRKKCWGEVSDFVSKYKGVGKLKALAGKKVKIEKLDYYVLDNGCKRFFFQMKFV